MIFFLSLIFSVGFSQFLIRRLNLLVELNGISHYPVTFLPSSSMD